MTRKQQREDTSQAMTVCVINANVDSVSVSAEEAKRLAAKAREKAQSAPSVHLTLADSDGVNIKIS